jgi:hypothetical protein
MRRPPPLMILTDTTGARMMTEAQLILELAGRVRRLSPHHRDPERFHLEKDEIARQLQRVARRCERNGD